MHVIRKAWHDTQAYIIVCMVISCCVATVGPYIYLTDLEKQTILHVRDEVKCFPDDGVVFALFPPQGSLC